MENTMTLQEVFAVFERFIEAVKLEGEGYFGLSLSLNLFLGNSPVEGRIGPYWCDNKYSAFFLSDDFRVCLVVEGKAVFSGSTKFDEIQTRERIRELIKNLEKIPREKRDRAMQVQADLRQLESAAAADALRKLMR